MLKLHTYYRSSAAYRVRIALALKGLPYESLPVHLLHGGGEQHAPAFAAVNPSRAVPVLVDGGRHLTQSLAIIEYLDELQPAPPLLPPDALGRARVRAVAQLIACDIHPLDNLRVLKYLQAQLGVDKVGKDAWYRHWVVQGFAALEANLSESADTGRCCHGDEPTLADCCLVPQVYNAERFGIALDEFPTLGRIVRHCAALDAFTRAAPDAQPDAPSPGPGSAPTS